MRNWHIILLLLFFTTMTQAGVLEPLVLSDQWGKEQVLNTETRLLIFSNHKDGSAWVKQALQELDISNLNEKHWLYVANISSMPKIITKLFAMPKMRKYAFPIALVRNKTMVQEWPKKPGFVAVYSLNNLAIESVEYFNTADAVKVYLQSQSH